MASDKQQVDRLERHRAGLLAAGALSVPPEAGRTAVITVYDPAKLAGPRLPADRLETMDREARRICGYLRWRGRAAVYLPEAGIEELWEVLDDVRVSDVVLIGLGQLSKVHIAPWKAGSGRRHEMASFFDAVSRNGARPAISHLKQGRFYQRTSGHMDSSPLNIPFAWGFMADRARIWAAPQTGFQPSQRHVRPRAGLVNLAAHFGLAAAEARAPMSYARAKEVFGARESLPSRRYPVPRFAQPGYDRLRASPAASRLHDGIRKNLQAAGLARP